MNIYGAGHGPSAVVYHALRNSLLLVPTLQTITIRNKGDYNERVWDVSVGRGRGRGSIMAVSDYVNQIEFKETATLLMCIDVAGELELSMIWQHNGVFSSNA